MPSPPSVIRQISRTTVKPSSPPPSSTVHLSPWDLAMLSPQYIQKGLLFTHLPASLTADQIADRLKTSLSAALRYFHPLSGRLVTQKQPDASSGIAVSIDCSRGGAEFIHAAADHVTAADVVALENDLPASLLQLFFPYDGAVNHDGHSIPLLAVQLTELADGVFVSCSFNHVVGDGTSYWHFFNAWAEIARAAGKDGGEIMISRPPVHDRWFIDGVGDPPFILPFSRVEEFIERPSPPPLRERMFHFSAESMAFLKAKANTECPGEQISSFQSLCALVWRCITRARELPAEQQTSCRLAIENRSRMNPRLSPDYFGNSIYAVASTATVGEVVGRGLGWAAGMLRRSVAGHVDEAVRAALRGWHESPVVYRLSAFDPLSVMVGSSPRFDMYGCDFGWGKAIAARSGSANKFNGKVSSYPGREGGGSVDLEICLVPEAMEALLADPEFMAAAMSLPVAAAAAVPV